MPILLKMNLGCNFECNYCYEKPIKTNEPIIDHKAVEETIRRLWEEGGGKGEDGEPKKDKKGNYRGPTITLHGGEPTILPKEDIERYLKLAFELTGHSGIQTNGYLIDDDIIEMFRKYKTSVGVSIDGPWPLNEFRGIGTKAQRKKQTKRIMATIKKLRETKLPEEYWRKDKDGQKIPRYLGVSVIAVIHKKNALGERREILKQWVKELDDAGIYGRLNICCTGNPEIDLTPLEAVDAYTDLCDFMLEKGLSRWSPFKDITNSLKGEDEVVCVFRNCDPFSTHSATSVLHDGSVGVCLRLYGDGKIYLRAEKESTIRSDVLRQTDCKDCPWWEHCYGGCSGLSKDWDWRNKDRYCEMYKALFVKISNALKALGVKKKRKKKSGRGSGRRSDGDHTDGIEHFDGNTHYIDSDSR
uniref:Putative radical SAM superfamily protein n=1 Tax=viral metagenome TaxID=1070528 RepID=A0A6M3MEP1_9ZZZZ